MPDKCYEAYEAYDAYEAYEAYETYDVYEAYEAYEAYSCGPGVSWAFERVCLLEKPTDLWAARV